MGEMGADYGLLLHFLLMLLGAGPSLPQGLDVTAPSGTEAQGRVGAL